jgi:hypothetical protein
LATLTVTSAADRRGERAPIDSLAYFTTLGELAGVVAKMLDVASYCPPTDNYDPFVLRVIGGTTIFPVGVTTVGLTVSKGNKLLNFVNAIPKKLKD